MVVRAGLALSGGGARGAFQVGVLEALDEMDAFEFQSVSGVSVGALNGSMVAQKNIKRMGEIWGQISQKKVYKKGFLPWNLLMILLGRKRGLYDNRPLRRLLEKEVDPLQFRIPFYAGVVDMETSKFHHFELNELMPDSALSLIWASATMPIIWEPVKGIIPSVSGIYNSMRDSLIDGGLRDVNPVGNLIKNPPSFDTIVSISCSPLETTAMSLKGIDGIAGRSLDIIMNEVFRNDIEGAERINRLIRSNSDVLKAENGRPYIPVKIIHFYPSWEVGGTLDFRQKTVTAWREHGRYIATKVMKKL